MIRNCCKTVKNVFICCFLLSVICPAFVFSMVQAAPDLQSFCQEQDWYAYVPQVKQIDADVDMQIANTALLTMQTQAVAGVPGMGVHTILLFDNSFSISEQNREIMKQAAAGIIAAHTAGEIYTVGVFDDSVHILAQESSDYEHLEKIIYSIEYANQPTCLKDALYTACVRYGTDGGYYKRFVVLSDGCDDNPVGYTDDEIKDLFLKKNYPVYAVGSRYEADTQALEKLFSIARVTGGVHFLLDEMTETGSIAEKLNSDAPVLFVRKQLPFDTQDGEMKEIRLIVYDQDEDRDFYTRTRMPFADMSTVSEIPEDMMLLSGTDRSEFPPESEEAEAADAEQKSEMPAEGTQTETEAVTETEPESEAVTETEPEVLQTGGSEEEKPFLEDDSLVSGVKNSYICMGAAIAAGLLSSAMLFRRKKETGDSREQIRAEDYISDPGDTADVTDDDSTVLLRKYPGPSVIRWSDRPDNRTNRKESI